MRKGELPPTPTPHPTRSYASTEARTPLLTRTLTRRGRTEEPAEELTRPGKEARRWDKSKGKLRKSQPEPATVAEAIVPKTTAIRGKEFLNEEAASAERLYAGSLVRIMSQHSCRERASDYLGGLVRLDSRSFVFCALHAHMRLSEALVKDMFGRAIESRKVDKLRAAFSTHLGIKDKFQRSSQSKGWNKVSLYGYECWRFGQTDPESGVSSIEKVIKEVWPAGKGILGSAAAPDKGSKRKQGRVRGGARQETRDAEEERFVLSYCALWRQFNQVVRQMRCKDPSDKDLQHFGLNCRDLGARWCMLLPGNRCSTFYLHTLMMHGGEFMEYCLERGLTIGMLENSGAERRHEIGRVMFKKSLSGGGKAYKGMKLCENRSAYLTLRGILIWQYGRDYLASLAAQQAVEAALQGKAGSNSACRTRAGCGWPTTGRSMAESFMRHFKSVENSKRGPEWEDKDKHDNETGDLQGVLNEKALMQWDRAGEGDPPVHTLVAKDTVLEDADNSFAFNDGTAVLSADGRDDDADSCESGLTGSSDRDEWEVRHDDLGDLGDYNDEGY